MSKVTREVALLRAVIAAQEPIPDPRLLVPLIQFTSKGGDLLAIDPLDVSAVETNKDAETEIHLKGGRSFMVQEAFSIVMQAITDAKDIDKEE